jgi:hypothetical protein
VSKYVPALIRLLINFAHTRILEGSSACLYRLDGSGAGSRKPGRFCDRVPMVDTGEEFAGCKGSGF